MGITFPGESSEYRAARDNLLKQEIELRRVTEAVAQARRELPPGGVVKEYVFAGASGQTTLAQQFAPGQDTLAVYSFMFGPERESPCPMCTGILDGLDAVMEHLEQRLRLVVVAESPLPRLLAFAERRGWRRLVLLSTAGNSYNRDYHGKDEQGHDTTMLNVFRRDGAQVRHFWGTELTYAPTEPGQDMRNVDIISPIFNMFDVTPEGRGDFYTKVSY